MNKYSINLLADNGNEMKMRPFWTGYFESLNEISIEEKEEEGTRYTF